jgi:hypothetical protein
MQRPPEDPPLLALGAQEAADDPQNPPANDNVAAVAIADAEEESIPPVTLLSFY